VDAGAVTDPVLELSLAHAREQRGEMALWLGTRASGDLNWPACLS